MAKYNYYAIINGNNESKICNSWDECVSFRSKNPSNAKFKGFYTEWEAQLWLNSLINNELQKETDKLESKINSSLPYKIYPNDAAIAYTDGSYNPKTKIYGYGVRLSDANNLNKNVHIFSGNNDIYSSARNVAGECDGAICAIKKAIELGYKKLIIRHDYIGVGAWITEEWSNTNTPVSKNYKQTMLTYKPFIDLSFEHVRGHTGEQYNEEVDQIAKQAVGLN